MSSLRRVGVTGIGCVSALGVGAGEFWRRLVAGQSGIQMVERTRCGDTVRFPAAVAQGYDARLWFSHQDLVLRDRFAQFAVVAAREAIADAGLDIRRDGLGEKTAVVMGTGGGGEESREEAAVQLFADRRGRCHPMLVPKTNNQASAGLVSIENGIQGPTLTVSTGCASSTHAIAQAFDFVRHGRVRVAVAGGSEASILYSVAKAFGAVRVLAGDTCRPFSHGRQGMVIGEGGGVLVLEELEHARARGARVYAELCGWGMTADAADPVHPCPDGPRRAMREALHDGGLPAESVGYVNAHGTGTPINDRVEAAAIRSAFGAHAERLLLSGTKSMHGHALGGTGALEAIATVLALHTGVVPPTANWNGPDPECGLDCVPNQARPAALEAALSNSFAFGGLNVVLALRRTVDAMRPDLGVRP